MSDRESLDNQPQRYGNPGGMDAGGADFDSGQQGQQSEQELASKMLQIQSKRFYLDVKENRRGKFIKVAEIGSDGRRSQIYLALSTASEFRNHLSTFSDFYASLGPPNSENVPDDGKLKSEMMVKDNRRYYLDLKENARGRFLRVSHPVSQTITRGGPRTQIAIPAQGLIEFRDSLTDLLEEFGTDDGGYKGDLPEGRYMRVDSKNFYFDIGQNNRGIYMRISEVKSNFRTAITVPEKSWERFRDIFADYCNKMKEGGAGVSVGMTSGGGGNVLSEGKGSVVAQVTQRSGNDNDGGGGGGSGGGGGGGVVGSISGSGEGGNGSGGGSGSGGGGGGGGSSSSSGGGGGGGGGTSGGLNGGKSKTEKRQGDPRQRESLKRRKSLPRNAEQPSVEPEIPAGRNLLIHAASQISCDPISAASVPELSGSNKYIEQSNPGAVTQDAQGVPRLEPIRV